MDRMKRFKKALPWIAAGVLALLSALCFLMLYLRAAPLNAQRAAQRWQGESETDFVQVSCFIPVDERRSLEDIYKFRQQIETKLHEAALDIQNDARLWVDAWSTTGKVSAQTELGKGEARVIAVGGEFFQFHPLHLLNGNYISEGDLMQDRVLLDEDMAWQLFGGTQLQGLELKLNGVPFVVAGVVEREQDVFSRRAYTAGAGLYMSFDAYKKLEEKAGIDCYELVMAEPVRGFARSFVREKFPLGRGEVVQNTGRFTLSRLWDVVAHLSTRSMQTLGVVYPYWENAARGAEDTCALLMLLGIVLALYPLSLLLARGWKLLKEGKEKLSDEVLPGVRDRAEEAVRVRQRRAWERRHGKHEM